MTALVLKFLGCTCCVLGWNQLASVCSSKREINYYESSPVIIPSRDTNAKKSKENSIGASPLCQGLKLVQLHVAGGSLLNVNVCINLPRSAPEQKVLPWLLLWGCWHYFTSTPDESFKWTQCKACDIYDYVVNIVFVTPNFLTLVMPSQTKALLGFLLFWVGFVVLLCFFKQDTSMILCFI